MSDFNQEKWNLPRRFEPSPENLEKWNAEQEELKRNFSIGKRSPRDILFQNALIRIEELNRLLDDKAATFTTFMARSLAENYAVVGNFDAASFHEPDLSLADEYKAIGDALQAEDQTRCSCPVPEGFYTNVGTYGEVFHEKLKRYVEIEKCVVCRRFTVKL